MSKNETWILSIWQYFVHHLITSLFHKVHQWFNQRKKNLKHTMTAIIFDVTCRIHGEHVGGIIGTRLCILTNTLVKSRFWWTLNSYQHKHVRQKYGHTIRHYLCTKENILWVHVLCKVKTNWNSSQMSLTFSKLASQNFTR